MNFELPRQFLEQVIYFRDLHTEFEWHFYEPHFKIWDNVNELFITIVMLYYIIAVPGRTCTKQAPSEVNVGRTRRACEHAHSRLAAIRPTCFCKAITGRYTRTNDAVLG